MPPQSSALVLHHSRSRDHRPRSTRQPPKPAPPKRKPDRRPADHLIPALLRWNARLEREQPESWAEAVSEIQLWVSSSPNPHVSTPGCCVQLWAFIRAPVLPFKQDWVQLKLSLDHYRPRDGLTPPQWFYDVDVPANFPLFFQRPMHWLNTLTKDILRRKPSGSQASSYAPWVRILSFVEEFKNEHAKACYEAVHPSSRAQSEEVN